MGALFLKVTLLLFAALVGGRLMQRSAAASRHHFWSVAFGALLVLPLLGMALPSLYLPVPARWQIVSQSIDPSTSPAAAVSIAQFARTVRTAVPSRHGDAVPAPQIAPERASTDVRVAVAVALMAIWICGTLVALGALMLSLWRVWRLSRAATGLNDPAWTRAATDLSARLGLRTSPRLLAANVTTPMAGGLWRPTVFLPPVAAAWTADLREIVLAHEIAHVAGRDALRHIAARLAVALYWFHPLVWIAARHASMAREEACDDAVLALGTRPSAYAQVLLDLAADPSCGLQAPAAALPIVECSLLEKRLMAILNTGVAPAPVRRWVASTVALTVVTVLIGAAQPRVRAAVLYARTADALLTTGATTVDPAPVDPAPVDPAAVDPAPVLSAAPSQITSSACTLDRGASFTGTMSMSELGGRTVVTQQIGVRGNDRIVQERVGDLNLA